MAVSDKDHMLGFVQMIDNVENIVSGVVTRRRSYTRVPRCKLWVNEHDCMKATKPKTEGLYERREKV